MSDPNLINRIRFIDWFLETIICVPVIFVFFAIECNVKTRPLLGWLAALSARPGSVRLGYELWGEYVM